MTKVERSVRFPCGYRSSIKFKIGWTSLFGVLRFNDEDMNICPLHGKDCLKEMRKKK